MSGLARFTRYATSTQTSSAGDGYRRLSREQVRQVARHAVLVAVLVGLAACGGGGAGAGGAIRVGDSVITTRTLDHWASVLGGGRLPAAGTSRLRAAMRGAAELLISAAWSTGEAGARGLETSAQALQRQLRAREAAEFPGGSAEMQSFLEATGETHADVELEAKAAWAASALRLRAMKEAPPVTSAQVAAYYNGHRARFAVLERREIVQTETKTQADAIVARRKMAADRELLNDSEPETLAIMPHAIAEARLRPAEAAIAAAKPHTLVGPVKQRVDYYVFEVKRVYPAHEEPLSRVGRAIVSQLTSERRARALAAFERAWVRKWSARTSCAGGYVVMPCRQFHGHRNLQLGFGLR
jgi:PPIC-type PPIASE domain